MHPKTHVKIMNIYNKYIFWVGFFNFIILTFVMVITKYFYIAYVMIGICLLIIIWTMADITWRIPVYCETVNCHHVMKKEKTKQPESEITKIQYKCLYCGSVYQATIDSPKGSNEPNIPGQW